MKTLLKSITYSLFLLGGVQCVTPVAYGQTTTTSTTLSAALTSSQRQVCVASSTGIAAPSFGATPITAIFVDREFMAVNASTSNSLCWTVTRGYSGTASYAHNSGATVYVGPTGGFGGSPFRNLSPQGGAGAPCTSTSEAYLPQIVVGGPGHNNQAGMVWTCPAAGAAGASLWFPTNAPEIAPILTDFEIFVPAGAMCSGSTTGTVGTGNGTVILDGSVPALKVAATNAAASHSNFDCNLTAGLRTTSTKGITLTSMAVVYSVQTTTATSMATPTISYFAAPAASTSESASSATLVTTTALVGGTLTMLPVVGSANLTAVSAGQYYTENISLGTPLLMNTDLRTYVLHFEIDQSASAAQIVTVAGVWLRGTQIPF